MATQTLDRNQANPDTKSEQLSKTTQFSYKDILFSTGISLIVILIIKSCLNWLTTDAKSSVDPFDISILFGLSLCITLITISKVLDLIDKKSDDKLLIATTVGFSSVSLLLSTTLGTLIPKTIQILLICFAIIPLTISVVVLLIWGFCSIKTFITMRVAVTYGLIGLTLAQFVGNIIVGNSLIPSSTDTAKACYIIGKEGTLLIPFAISLHMIQFILLLGKLTKTSKLSYTEIIRLLSVCFAGLTGLVVIGFIQALSGRSILNLNLFMFLGSILCISSVAYPYIRTLFSIKK
ncbi:MAG: hypothetical protein HY606_12740 [Planctomycetes bacterium]|nr:hypothetical protein [Planctomycetota bacterium]